LEKVSVDHLKTIHAALVEGNRIWDLLIYSNRRPLSLKTLRFSTINQVTNSKEQSLY